MAWVRFGERTMETAQLEDRAARAATGLKALGIGAADVIAVCMRNDFPFLEATFAAGKLGAYVTPVNWHNTVAEAQYVFADCGAKAIVIHADLYRDLEAALPPGVPVFVAPAPQDVIGPYRIAPEKGEPPAGVTLWSDLVDRNEPLPIEELPTTAPGSMIYTSGTTGKPKGVRRLPPTEEQAQATADMIAVLFGTAGKDPAEITAFCAGPLYHSTPNGWIPYFIRLGANMVVHTRFDAEAMLADIEKFKITHALAVPTMFVRLLKLPEEVRAKYDVSSLQFVMHGAAPCPPEVKRAMIQWWGPVIWEHYGGTETGAVTLCDSEGWLAHPGTVGKALPDAKIMVLTEEGDPVEGSGVGEIASWRPLYPDFTYNGDDEKRKRAARHGLVSLGDMGYIDADGYLYLAGRASDMVISGGVNIYPAEIEAELLKMPEVADGCVFGIPDDEFGEQLCAYVQPKAGQTVTPDQVKAFLGGVVARYKIPKTVKIVDDLPREDSGKIFKRKLREPYWADAGRAI